MSHDVQMFVFPLEIEKLYKSYQMLHEPCGLRVWALSSSYSLYGSGYIVWVNLGFILGLTFSLTSKKQDCSFNYYIIYKLLFFFYI